MAAEPLQPWEQLDNEGPEAYEAFCVYRDLGPTRSIVKAGKQLGKARQTLEEWSSPRRHDWLRRVLAWDRHEARIINAEVLSGTAHMRKRQAAAGINMQTHAANAVLAITPQQLAAMSPAQVVAFAKAGAEMERAARAIPQDERDRADREDAPTFVVNFLPSRPPNMVSVRLATGEAGYIPAERVDEFLAEYEGSVAIR